MVILPTALAGILRWSSMIGSRNEAQVYKFHVHKYKHICIKWLDNSSSSSLDTGITRACRSSTRTPSTHCTPRASPSVSCSSAAASSTTSRRISCPEVRTGTTWRSSVSLKLEMETGSWWDSQKSNLTLVGFGRVKGHRNLPRHSRGT